MCPDSGDGPEDRRPRSGISLQTLIVASVASAAASFAVARIWGPGTLFGAAAAPVIIALVSEGLRRPMRTVTATAKKVPSVPTVLGRGTAPPVDPTPRETGTWRPRWWMAVVTGLVAFAIVLGVFTVPDLIAGSSITGNGQPTTFFGGSSKAKKTKRSTTTATTTTHTKTARTTATTTATTTTTKTHTATTSPTTTTTLSTTTTTTPTSSATSSTATSIGTETASKP